MIKKTFRYCGTHKGDEAYMAKMVSQGWAAVKLTEGFWTFESCQPNEYCFRICYLRGKSSSEIEALKEQYAREGIEFVSRYSFWAILRSRKQFELYTPEEELEICRKIYAPMPVGAVVSWVLTGVLLFLVFHVSLYFLIPAVLTAVYGGVCTWLAVAYHKLLKKLGGKSGSQGK